MQLEVGAIMSGRVKSITKFGAFVELENKKTGLVHISEISDEFVKEVKDHLKEGQEVKVKIIGISKEGKIELSIKKVNEKPEDAIKREEMKKKISASKFEDMMNKFKRLSDDKLLDFKKKSEPRKNKSSHKNGI